MRKIGGKTQTISAVVTDETAEALADIAQRMSAEKGRKVTVSEIVRIVISKWAKRHQEE